MKIKNIQKTNMKLKLLFLLLIITSVNNAQELINSINCAKIGDQSVVSIKTYDSSGNHISSGSGVLISNDGKIVTNFHVYEGGSTMIVNHQGNEFNINSILYENKSDDLLIFSIKDSYLDNSFKPIVLGNVSEIVKGQTVYAIGNTFGQYEGDNRITQGIVSSNRKNMIEFSASINHGNSGGALIDDNCKLIGLVTQKDKKSENIGFAIPVDKIKLAISNITEQDFPNHYKPRKVKPKLVERKGKVMLYLSQNSRNNIEVYYNDTEVNRLIEVGVLRTVFYEKPTICNQSGTITFKLPIGKHQLLLYVNEKFIKQITVNIKDSSCYSYAIHVNKQQNDYYSQPSNPKRYQKKPTYGYDFGLKEQNKDIVTWNGAINYDFMYAINKDSINYIPPPQSAEPLNSRFISNLRHNINLQIGVGLYPKFPNSVIQPYGKLNLLSLKTMKFDHTLYEGGKGNISTLGIQPEIGLNIFPIETFFFDIYAGYYIPYLKNIVYNSGGYTLDENYPIIPKSYIKSNGFSFSFGIGLNIENSTMIKLNYFHDLSSFFHQEKDTGIVSIDKKSFKLSVIWGFF